MRHTLFGSCSAQWRWAWRATHIRPLFVRYCCASAAKASSARSSSGSCGAASRRGAQRATLARSCSHHAEEHESNISRHRRFVQCSTALRMHASHAHGAPAQPRPAPAARRSPPAETSAACPQLRHHTHTRANVSQHTAKSKRFDGAALPADAAAAVRHVRSGAPRLRRAVWRPRCRARARAPPRRGRRRRRRAARRRAAAPAARPAARNAPARSRNARRRTAGREANNGRGASDTQKACEKGLARAHACALCVRCARGARLPRDELQHRRVRR